MIRTVVILLWLAAPLSFTGWAMRLDESPAGPGDWGYRPSEVTKIALNPPGFTWHSCKKAAAYALQIAADPEFKHVVYARDGLPWNAHCPSLTLPHGTLYWRYGAKSRAGNSSDWSRVRSFQMPEGAVPFPQPPIEELLERIPAEHPRLFFRPEDIPRLRELADGPLADRWSELKARARRTLQDPPDTSEPPLYPKGTVRKSNEWRKTWWGNRMRVIAVADGAATLGFVYRISSDEKYAHAARDLVMAMTKWDPKGSTRYQYNDEAAMPALYMTSRAYSWAYPAFSKRDRKAVVKMMRIRGRQAFDRLRATHHLWRPYDSHNNRCWHYLGELAIAFYDEIPEAEAWLDYAMTLFYTCYPAWGDADGGWHEGTAYWNSYTSRFMLWADVIRSAFDIDIFERPFYQRTGYYAMYTMPPGAQTGGFGDLAVPMSPEQVAPLMAVLANGARNRHWQWYAETCGGHLPGGYLGFIHASHAAGLEPEAPTDLPTSTAFRGVGLALLNATILNGKENVQVHFKSSPFGRQSHGYNANNAFLLNLRGRPALVRSGARDIYGSSHHTRWMWDSKSDNAILVNGEGQIKHSPDATGRIAAFKTSPRLDLVVGEAGASYENLNRWTRRLAFFKPYAVLIHDVLEAPEPATYEWTLHGAGPFDIGEQVTWSGEPGNLAIRFLTPQGLVITQTDEMDPPPHDWASYKPSSWHLTAKTTEKAANQEFITIIAIDGAEVTVNYEKDTGTLLLDLPEGSAVVRLSPDAFRLTGLGVDWEIKQAR